MVSKLLATVVSAAMLFTVSAASAQTRTNDTQKYNHERFRILGSARVPLALPQVIRARTLPATVAQFPARR